MHAVLCPPPLFIPHPQYLQVPPQINNKAEREKLDNLYKRLSELKKTFIGYPCDAEFGYFPPNLCRT